MISTVSIITSYTFALSLAYGATYLDIVYGVEKIPANSQYEEALIVATTQLVNQCHELDFRA